MDDLIANFTAITGADPARAQQYLTLTDNNLEHAIQLYFDSDGADMGASVPQAAAAQPSQPAGATRPSYSEDAHGVVTIDSDDEGDSNMAGTSGASGPRPQAPYEDDEAMARRLQEEMYGQGGQEEVRAPIARTTETLAGPDADYYGGGDDDDMQAAVMEQLMNRQRRSAGRPGIFNQRLENSVWDDTDPEAQRQARSRMTGGASEQSNKTNLLAQLFQPPVDIISNLSWSDAREEGKEEEKWLLVNVQDPSVFDCSALNRDIWRNSQIKETIKENFIFMQFNKADPSAAQYVNYYLTQNRDNDAIYPHVAIVDPRTGEQVKIWSGSPIPTASDFLMDLHEFLDRYSLKAFAKNPVANRKPEQKSKDVERMSEEEMLEMAMQNSLNKDAAGETGKSTDPDALTKHIQGKGKNKVVDPEAMDTADMGPVPTSNSTEPAEASASPFAQIPSDRPHTEPTDPATSTRIQFRYSGGRQIRRFGLDEQVRRIYEWLKASPIDGKDGVEFDLIFMGKNLMAVSDQTIEEAGLKNGSVMVEFLEEES